MSSPVDPDKIIETLQPDRCPLCFLTDDYGHEHLKSVLEESVTDPSTRQALFESKGFCRRHAWKAVGQSHPLGLAVIYASLLEAGLKGLGTRRGLFSQRGKKACPICESEKKRDQALVRQFALGWEKSEPLRRAFAQKGILCLPHLERALGEKMAAAHSQTLRETAKKALEGLLTDLNEFLEKQDYHRSHESFGKERDAWVRVVRMVSGERE